MSLGYAIFGGAIAEYNRMDEAERLAIKEKNAKDAEAAAAEKARLQAIADEKDMKRFDLQLKNDQFNSARGRAYSELNSRRQAYKAQGVNAYLYVDNENTVQETRFDEALPGWDRDTAETLRNEFLKDPYNSQGGVLRGARVIPVEGQTDYYNLEYYDIPKVDASDSPDSARNFMLKYQNDPSFAHLNIGIKQTDSGKWINTFELKTKETPQVTRAELQEGLAAEQSRYPDYDVFIVGKPGQVEYSYVKKDRVTSYEDAQASAEKLRADFPYLQVLVDGDETVGYTVRTVQKETKLFESRDQAKQAADQAKQENPEYNYVVIGSNKEGWGYEIRDPEKTEVVAGIDDPNVADQDFDKAVPYNMNYFVFAETGTFDLGEKAIDRQSYTIPLTKAADDAIASPGPAMKDLKNKRGTAWVNFLMPKQVSDDSYPDDYLRAVRRAFSPELVKKLAQVAGNRDRSGVNPDRAVQIEAYRTFRELLSSGVNNYIRGTTLVLGESTEFELPEQVSSILNEYRGINSTIDAIIDDTFDQASLETLQTEDMIVDVPPEVETVAEDTPVEIPVGADGQPMETPTPTARVRVKYEKFPNVKSSTLVEPIMDPDGNATGGYYLKADTRGVLEVAARNAGFINPETGEPQVNRVLRILNTAEGTNGNLGPAAVEEAFNSLVELQAFFGPDQRTMQARPAGSGKVRSFTEPLDTAEREQLALLLDPFPDHVSRMNAIRMAIPKTVLASRRSKRKSSSPEAILAAVSGGRDMKRIAEEGRIGRKALDITASLEKLFAPAQGSPAQIGPAADILRIRNAAGYVFTNIIGNLDVNPSFGETREQLQSRLRADFAAIPDGDSQQARNALARFLIENLTYVNASMNDPNGRLSEGDRIQSQTAIGAAQFFTSPGEILPVVRLINEKAAYVAAFGSAVDSGSQEQVLAAVIYDENYMAGRVD